MRHNLVTKQNRYIKIKESSFNIFFFTGLKAVRRSPVYAADGARSKDQCCHILLKAIERVTSRTLECCAAEDALRHVSTLIKARLYLFSIHGIEWSHVCINIEKIFLTLTYYYTAPPLPPSPSLHVLKKKFFSNYVRQPKRVAV